MLVPAGQVISRLHELGGHRVLVVGDVVLDRYVIGRATRLSREAPVPVVVHERTFALPGSAANPSLNVQALGSHAIQASIIGADAEGDELVALLRDAGVDTAAVLRLPARRTDVKERILARGALRYPQQLLRVDRLEQRPLSPADLTQLADRVEQRLGEAQVLLLSDYCGGSITGPVLEACLGARQQGTAVCVDAQSDLWRYRGATCVKCNRDEAGRALGESLDGDGDFERATETMLARLDATVVAITRGERGMSLRHADHGYMAFAAPNRTEVFDVVGAGDTVIAIMALAFAAGWDPALAATVAQLGAGIVVQRLGNATTTLAEMAQAAEAWL
ncbi:MAG: bifunctional heptose 7-phosphate kinase/heptose 1-phosphate adenyltransferase [Anaerolineae bacterium]